MIGGIPAAELRKAVGALRADEVGTAEEMRISPSVAKGLGSPVLAVWWD